MDRGVWRATVHGVTKSRTQLSYFHTFTCGRHVLSKKDQHDIPSVQLV